MLTVYISKSLVPKERQVLFDNDAKFFSDFSAGETDITPDMKHIAKVIDNSDIISNRVLRTRRGDFLSPIYLSTGAKTAFNILNNPDLVVSTDECGENALEAILDNIASGSVVMEEKPTIFDYGKDCKVYLVTHYGNYECSNLDEVNRFWYGIY